ncbi:MAG: hypothetical protein SOI54_06865 [Acetobacter sp.]|jgi:hypothetical protein
MKFCGVSNRRFHAIVRYFRTKTVNTATSDQLAPFIGIDMDGSFANWPAAQRELTEPLRANLRSSSSPLHPKKQLISFSEDRIPKPRRSTNSC